MKKIWISLLYNGVKGESLIKSKIKKFQRNFKNVTIITISMTRSLQFTAVTRISSAKSNVITSLLVLPLNKSILA